MIGFVGMTHLGLNMATATALKGFDVSCFDENNNLVKDLNSGKINIDEPGLKDSIKKEQKRILFTNSIEHLNKCELIYISPDIETDNEGNSDLSYIENLIKSVDLQLDKKIPFIILSQVPPGFTSSLNLERKCYYQVETLIFGQALDRATYPERIIVGSKNKNISEKYKKFLNRFTRNIIVMNLEREDAVIENRKLMGATNPADAKDGTLRKKYGISIDKNSVHGSDNLENAKIELEFFFNN